MSDKELIKQEIEKLHELLPVMDGDNVSINYAERICTALETYIDSLPEEPASEGLIEEIDKIWKTCNPIDEGMGVETANIHIEQFDDIARHFAEWQKQKAMQDFLEKAEKWIEKHIEMFSWVHCGSDGNEEWINDFKNYMQDE